MSKDSLESYKRSVELNYAYADISGLFEILESVYIQLCLSDPYFNAYTRYVYFNVTRTHSIQFFKQIDTENSEVFSQLLFYCYRVRGIFEIVRFDESYIEELDNDGKITTEPKILKATDKQQFYKLDSSTFMVIKDYLKNWFDEILISVKKSENYDKLNERF